MCSFASCAVIGPGPRMTRSPSKKEEGFNSGERAGAERGAMQEKIGIAKNFKKSGIPIDVIAKNTGLSEKEIAEL